MRLRDFRGAIIGAILFAFAPSAVVLAEKTKPEWTFDISNEKLTSDDMLVLLANGLVTPAQAIAWIEQKRPDLMGYVSKIASDPCATCGGTGVVGTQPCPHC